MVMAQELFNLFVEKGGAIMWFEDHTHTMNDNLRSYRIFVETDIIDPETRDVILKDIQKYVDAINYDSHPMIRENILLNNLKRGEMLMITKVDKFKTSRFIVFAGHGVRTNPFKVNTIENVCKLNKHIYNNEVITRVIGKWTGDTVIHKINFEKLLEITNNNRVYGL